jgi:hypothetical protein
MHILFSTPIISSTIAYRTSLSQMRLPDMRAAAAEAASTSPVGTLSLTGIKSAHSSSMLDLSAASHSDHNESPSKQGGLAYDARTEFGIQKYILDGPSSSSSVSVPLLSTSASVPLLSSSSSATNGAPSNEYVAHLERQRRKLEKQQLRLKQQQQQSASSSNLVSLPAEDSDEDEDEEENDDEAAHEAAELAEFERMRNRVLSSSHSHSQLALSAEYALNGTGGLNHDGIESDAHQHGDGDDDGDSHSKSHYRSHPSIALTAAAHNAVVAVGSDFGFGASAASTASVASVAAGASAKASSAVLLPPPPLVATSVSGSPSRSAAVTAAVVTASTNTVVGDTTAAAAAAAPSLGVAPASHTSAKTATKTPGVVSLNAAVESAPVLTLASLLPQSSSSSTALAAVTSVPSLAPAVSAATAASAVAASSSTGAGSASGIPALVRSTSSSAAAKPLRPQLRPAATLIRFELASTQVSCSRHGRSDAVIYFYLQIVKYCLSTLYQLCLFSSTHAFDFLIFS